MAKMEGKKSVPGRIRTRDPLLRRQPLCPTELLGLERRVAQTHCMNAAAPVSMNSTPANYTSQASCQ